MKKILISSSSVALLGLPFLALAEGINASYLTSFFTASKTILNSLIVFLFGLAVVWFIWNVVRYAMSEDEGGKEKAKSQMIHGIIAIAVTVSIWGIVGLLRTAFGVDGNNSAPTDINNMIPGGSNNGGVEDYTPANSDYPSGF